MRAFTGWTKAGWALVLVLTAVNVYRAATQSITTDEAFTFNSFVDTPVADAIRFYDANNHVLYSLAERASVAVFGISEFSVRLPAVLGGALYLWAALRLCFYVFGENWLALACLAVMGGNPFIMDYLSAARGYGMGLGLLLFALDRMVRHVAEGKRGAPYGAAVALGLAVAANLIYAVPAAAMGCVLAVWMARERGKAAMWDFTDSFVLPAVVTAFVLLVVPLSQASGGSYYYGAAKLAESVSSVVQAMFCPPIAKGMGQRVALLLYERLWLAPPFAALLAAAAGAGAVAALCKRGRPGPADACLAFTGGAIALGLAAFLAGHHLWGVPYPNERTGIYWVPLFALACLTAVRGRFPRLAAGALATLCAVQFALLLRVDYYGNWLDDAGTRRVVAQLRARESGARPVRVAVNANSEQTMRFYGRCYGLAWLVPVRRERLAGRADYYVLWSADAEEAEKRRLTVLYRDSLSGLLLAR